MTHDIFETDQDFDAHELAERFPLMSDDPISTVRFSELVEDIKNHGQQEPIWLYQGLILDGRNRYRACKRLKIKVKYKEYKGSKPEEFVASLNEFRRQLSFNERLSLANKLIADGMSIRKAAILAHVDRKSIYGQTGPSWAGTSSIRSSIDQIDSNSPPKTTIIPGINLDQKFTKFLKHLIEAKNIIGNDFNDRKEIAEIIKLIDEISGSLP
jgi:hypothetical protein